MAGATETRLDWISSFRKIVVKTNLLVRQLVDCKDIFNRYHEFILMYQMSKQTKKSARSIVIKILKISLMCSVYNPFKIVKLEIDIYFLVRQKLHMFK